MLYVFKNNDGKTKPPQEASLWYSFRYWTYSALYSNIFIVRFTMLLPGGPSIPRYQENRSFLVGAFTYYVITFSKIFEPSSPLCIQVSLLSNHPPIIMSTSCEPSFPLTKCIIAVFQNQDFSNVSKKYKT